jgi:acetyl esterase
MKTIARLIAASAAVACLLSSVHGAELTSQTHEQLKQWLRQFPDADANSDGVLTQSEAQAYRAKIRQARQGQVAGKVKPDHADVKYGPHERNVVDLWLAKDAGPRPLVIFIHGGGWVGGDKAQVPPADIAKLLNAGISVASINYRFSTMAPFPAPIRDGGLAVQFLRHNASQYNLDPARVACYGGSAGAVTSLWLAFHEDLADPKASDPVLRQSTRLTCAGSIAGPTTIDKKTMDDWFGMKVVTHPAILPFYGVKTEAELYSEKVQKVAAEASPIEHATKDDPPVYLAFPQDLMPLPPKHSPGEMVHHPLFGVKLKEKLDSLGVECIFEARNRPQDKYEGGLIGFLIAKLTRNPPTRS